jgi:hypothetical protein
LKNSDPARFFFLSGDWVVHLTVYAQLYTPSRISYMEVINTNISTLYLRGQCLPEIQECIDGWRILLAPEGTIELPPGCEIRGNLVSTAGGGASWTARPELLYGFGRYNPSVLAIVGDDGARLEFYNHHQYSREAEPCGEIGQKFLPGFSHSWAGYAILGEVKPETTLAALIELGEFLRSPEGDRMAGGWVEPEQGKLTLLQLPAGPEVRGRIRKWILNHYFIGAEVLVSRIANRDASLFDQIGEALVFVPAHEQDAKVISNDHLTAHPPHLEPDTWYYATHPLPLPAARAD